MISGPARLFTCELAKIRADCTKEFGFFVIAS